MCVRIILLKNIIIFLKTDCTFKSSSNIIACYFLTNLKTKTSGGNSELKSILENIFIEKKEQKSVLCTSDIYRSSSSTH